MFVSSNLPRWLEVLLSEKFFNACIIHEEEKKNEKNIYCLDCCTSLCPHCLSLHGSHRLLQIRRYVYNDVIRLDDAAKLVDCDYVQPYTTNSAKVVFINQRPQTRVRSSGNICSTCDRSLQDAYLFCSLSCKINYLIRIQGGLSKFFFECKFLPLPESSFDNSPLTWFLSHLVRLGHPLVRMDMVWLDAELLLALRPQRLRRRREVVKRHVVPCVHLSPRCR